MYINYRRSDAGKDRLARYQRRFLPVLAFAFCSILAMAGAEVLREYGLKVPWCIENPDSLCIGL